MRSAVACAVATTIALTALFFGASAAGASPVVRAQDEPDPTAALVGLTAAADNRTITVTITNDDARQSMYCKIGGFDSAQPVSVDSSIDYVSPPQFGLDGFFVDRSASRSISFDEYSVDGQAPEPFTDGDYFIYWNCIAATLIPHQWGTNPPRALSGEFLKPVTVVTLAAAPPPQCFGSVCSPIFALTRK